MTDIDNNPSSLIKDLIDNDCVKVGCYRLKNGKLSKYYFDMKNIISSPSLLSKIGDMMIKQINKDNYDVICGIPHGGMPIALYISIKTNIPLIYIRNNTKEYGTCKQIEGKINKHDRCLLIDDVLTSGKSIRDAVEVLNKHNIVTKKAFVVLDRQELNHSNKQYNDEKNYDILSLCNRTDYIRCKIEELSKIKKSRLCFSADVQNGDKLLEMLEKIGKHIVICKIHHDIIHDFNEVFIMKLLELSVKHDFLIMEDRKFLDISYIVNKQYANISSWTDMITVHGLATDECVKYLNCVVLVANMSNDNNNDFTNEAINKLKCNESRILGFVTQKRINLKSNVKMINMTPGISLENKHIDDQKYDTPNNIDSDYIIVGRNIYESPNILDTVTLFNDLFPYDKNEKV